jgi:tRNA pseudouridine38-40 synthase
MPRTRRLRMVLEYDGTSFHGFQRNEGVRTVQGEVEQVLAKLGGGPVETIGAGRTDTGVHALHQVIHWDTDSTIPAERVEGAVTSRLGGEIRVSCVEEAPEGFHARFSARSRTYWYWFDRERPSPFQARYVTWGEWLRPDAVERIRAALPALLGKQDFASFCGAESTARNTVRTVLRAELVERGSLLKLEITADGFLKSMVRAIAGVLLDIGRGKMEPDALGQILAARARGAARTAPPEGLFLAGVEYPDGYPQAERWRGFVPGRGDPSGDVGDWMR